MIKPFALFHPSSGGGTGTPITNPSGTVSPLNGYVTLDVVKESIRSGATTYPNPTLAANVPDDAAINQYIYEVSRAIDSYCGDRRFYPFRKTFYYCTPPDYQLDFNNDLLEVITLTNGDATTISSTDYTLHNRNYYPRYALSLKNSSNLSFLPTDDNDYEDAITVDALWGYNTEWANAWQLAGSINNSGGYNTTATAWNVAANTIIEQGHLLRAGTLSTSEIVLVDTVGSTSAISVVRGVNGTTAATLADATPIYVYRPMGLVQSVARIGVLDLYRKRTGASGEGGAVTLTAAGVVIRPQGLPVELRDAFAALGRKH